jgi:hypothetical protein
MIIIDHNVVKPMQILQLQQTPTSVFSLSDRSTSVQLEPDRMRIDFPAFRE